MPTFPLHSPRPLAFLALALATSALPPLRASAIASSSAPPSAVPQSSAAAAGSLSFSHLSSIDLDALKSTLEKAGWPEAHVKAVLNVEVQRRLNPEPVLRLEDLKPFHFWHTGPDALPIANLNTPDELKKRADREELARAKFMELFPAQDPEAILLDQWEEQRRWGALPPEKRAQVTALLERSEKARDQFLEDRGRMLNREEWEKLWQANRDARRQLAEILTADELLDYDLRNSNTASQMRIELDAFAPTREEFVALFRLRHPLELEFEDKPRDIDPAIDARRDAAEKELPQKIAALLGPERFDDYRISLEPDCQRLRFDGRYARTDAATVRRLYRTLQKTKAQLASLASQPLLQRDATAASLKAGLHREFRTVLDEEGTRRFLQEQSLWP